MSSSAIVGAILGTAIGDALGLPYENLSRRRGVRLLGEPERYRFFFGRGMVSDDTEHTCLVAQALLASGGDPDRYVRQLGWRLRWWLLSMPVGLGRATLLASLKLWCGFPPQRSGIQLGRKWACDAQRDSPAQRLMIGAIAGTGTCLDPYHAYGPTGRARGGRCRIGGASRGNIPMWMVHITWKNSGNFCNRTRRTNSWPSWIEWYAASRTTKIPWRSRKRRDGARE